MGVRCRRECARYDWRLDVHVDLLTDEKRGTVSRNSMDHLKNAGIHAFGGIARERFLGDDVAQQGPSQSASTIRITEARPPNRG
jgi:hypothetical protein